MSILILLLLGCPSSTTDPCADTAGDQACDDDDSHDDDDTGDDDDSHDDDDAGDDDDSWNGDPEDPTQVPVFEDWTSKSGVGTTAAGGCGISIADVDQDGWPDFFVTQGGSNARLFRNRGDGTFEDVAAAWGLGAETDGEFGASFADYDADGDPDLWVARDGPDRLYRNDGGGFTDVTAQAGVEGWVFGTSASVAWADYDGDGDLDAYVTHAESRDRSEKGPINAPDTLFRNDGGTFTDVSDLLEALPTSGWGFVAGWSDFDHDGDPDLYVVNDIGHIVPNHFFRNDGPSAEGHVFTTISEDCGCMLAISGMGVAIGDYDRDGWQDLYLSNGAIEQGDGKLAEYLLRNTQDNLFVDTTLATNAIAADLPERESSWGVEFLDVDNDGWLDLYVPFGQRATSEPDALLYNEGGSFVRLQDAGVETTGWSMGVGVVDFDRDGCLDVVVSNRNEGGIKVLHNRCRWGNGWLQVELVGAGMNRDAIGAVVTAQVGDLTLREEVQSGSTSAHSTRTRILQFGLGDHEAVDSLEVRWPDGTTEVTSDVAGGQLLRIEQ
jgi:enediyne biosynthesis protein E4